MNFEKILDPIEYKAANFLLNGKSGLKTYEAIMADRRVEAFKGQHATKAILAAEIKSLGIKINTADEAQVFLKKLLDKGVFIRAKTVNGIKVLQPDPLRTWSDDAFYVWVMKGSNLSTLIGALILFVGAIVVVLYPLWPRSLRHVSWYVMVCGFGFLGFLLFTAIIRLITFCLTYYLYPPGIWIFPNLFEDVSVIDSFIPLWSWHKKHNNLVVNSN